MGTRAARNAVLLLSMLGGAPAWAQQGQADGFDAHGFHLAAHDGDLRDALVVQRPGAVSQLDVFLAMLAEYARSPLVQVSEAELSGQVVETPVLDHLVTANLSAGIAPLDRLRFDVVAPVYLVSTDQRDAQTLGPAPGDLRASAMVLGVRPQHVVGGGGLGIGLIGHVDIPVGTPDRFLGQEGIAGGARVAATYEWPVVTLSADVGTQFNPALDLGNLNNSDTVLASVAIGALASDSVGFTLEAAAQPPFTPPENLTFPAEGLASLRYKDRATGAWWTFGGALGLTSGPGVAAFRVFVGAGLSKQEPPRPMDTDAIGAFVSRDKCPLQDEVVNGWQDDDGCPDTLSALAIDVRYRGEPVEADADLTGPTGNRSERIARGGLHVDAVPGSEWSVAARSGACLVGTASGKVRDGGTALRVDLVQRLESRVRIEVVDEQDQLVPDAVVSWTGPEVACLPDAREIAVTNGVAEHDIGVGQHHLRVTAPARAVHDEDVAFAAGDQKVLRIVLPVSRIRVEKQQIVILEKVMFETAKAVIRSESFPLLDEVAATIVTNPDLGRVEVAGHTDNRGSDSYNLTLSDQRAASVRRYLAEHGVPEERLVAVGYGETRPLDTNKTPEGREMNRRVEFNLIDQAPAGDEEGAPAEGAGEGAE